MGPLDFLRLVLPSHGYYCVCELTTQVKYHEYSTDLESLMPQVDRWVDQRRDVYFALATFEEPGARTAANAAWIKSLFIDMDGYDSPKAAAMALGRFLPQVGLDALGAPTLVVSGGGVHAYWPFAHEIDIVTWKPIAENFKRLCKQEGLAIDMSVTADSARVLRVPGTWNFKPKYPEPKPVVLKHLGGTFDHEELGRLIVSKLTTPAWQQPSSADIIALPGARPAAATVANVKLFANDATYFKNIIVKTVSGEGCGQLEHYLRNAKDDGMEPLWRGLLSIAEKCTDGWKSAVKLTQMHPYTDDRLRQKWHEVKGPYPCRAFDDLNPGICPDCKHWGKITNPLALGRETVTTVEAKEVEVKPAQVVDAPVSYERPALEYPYSYGVEFGMYVETTDPDTKKPKTVRFLDDILFVIGVLENQGDKYLRLFTHQTQGTKELVISTKALASKDETLKALNGAGILASSVGAAKHLHAYVHDVGRKAIAAQRAMTIPDHFGWQPDKSFVCGGKIYRAGKLPSDVPMKQLENIVQPTIPVGTLEAWRRFPQMLIARGEHEVLAALLAGAAAPLMEFTGLFGMTMHFGSSESGTGKSLSLMAAASVWGHPNSYRTGKGTSHVAMQQRLGLLHSLPLITDEITVKSRKGDDDWVQQFLLDMTEGKGKERMEASTNKERLNLTAWRTFALLSSNTHLSDVLTSQKHTAEGEIRRLLEVKMHKHLEFTDRERDILRGIFENYAVAGALTAQWLVDHYDTLKDRVSATQERIMRQLNATSDERFWVGMIACMIEMGVIWAEMGLLQLPLKEIFGVMARVVDDMRQCLRDGRRTALDILFSYVQENYGQMIIVRDEQDSKVVMFGNTTTDLSTARTEVRGRVEMRSGKDTMVVLPRALLKAFCTAHSFDYSTLQRELSLKFYVEANAQRDLGKGTKAGVPMITRVMVVHLPADISGLLPTETSVATG